MEGLAVKRQLDTYAAVLNDITTLIRNGAKPVPSKCEKSTQSSQDLLDEFFLERVKSIEAKYSDEDFQAEEALTVLKKVKQVGLDDLKFICSHQHKATAGGAAEDIDEDADMIMEEVEPTKSPVILNPSGGRELDLPTH